MLHNPYLRDIIKAFLTYDFKLAWKILKIHYPNWKLFQNWELIKVQQEFLKTKPKGSIDVLWVIKHKEKDLEKRIIHEIKTSKQIDVEKIWKKYKIGNSYLFIWCWKNAKLINLHKFQLELNTGWLRLIELELIIPYIKNKIEKILKKL